MAEISKKEYSRYFFIALLVLMLILAFLLIKPFMTSLLLGLIFAYAFYPFYSKLNSKIKNSTITSAIMVVLIVIVLAVPTYFIIKSLILEAAPVYSYVTEITEKIPYGLKDIVQKGAVNFLTSITPSVTSLKDSFFSFFVFLFFLYYFLKEGNEIINFIKGKVPLNSAQKDKVILHFKKITYAVLYGYIFVGIIMGILAAVGFHFLGISSPVFWSIIITLLSILPVLGASLVWVPMVVIDLIRHDYTAAIALALFSIIVLEGVESLLKSKLISDKSKVHPLIILIGIFGGLKLMGITGVIFGPLVLVVFIELINIIIKDKSQKIV